MSLLGMLPRSVTFLLGFAKVSSQMIVTTVYAAVTSAKTASAGVVGMQAKSAAGRRTALLTAVIILFGSQEEQVI